MTPPLLRFLLVLLAAAAPIAAPAAAAYPDRPITMIVAYPAGGGTDLVARALVPFIEKNLGGGAKIVVQNRTGAGGEIGFTALASAPPDGYTIGFVNTPNLITIPIERRAKYKWQDFDLLGNIVDDPGNFAVHADSSIRTLADLAAYAKANPGKVTVGTTGTGSDDHLAMLMFQRIAGVKMLHVPFKGAAEVRTNLAGRQIDVGAINIGEALQAQKGGAAIRNLGQMSPARTNLAPDVPTFREQGFNVELSSLRGMGAPRGLPGDVRERLVRAIERSVADPEFQASAAKVYAPLRYLAPPQFESVLRTAEGEFRQLWKEMPWGEQ